MATTSENGSVEDRIKNVQKTEESKPVAVAAVVQGEAQEDWPAPVIAQKPKEEKQQNKAPPKRISKSCLHLTDVS